MSISCKNLKCPHDLRICDAGDVIIFHLKLWSVEPIEESCHAVACVLPKNDSSYLFSSLKYKRVKKLMCLYMKHMYR